MLKVGIQRQENILLTLKQVFSQISPSFYSSDGKINIQVDIKYN